MQFDCFNCERNVTSFKATGCLNDELLNASDGPGTADRNRYVPVTDQIDCKMQHTYLLQLFVTGTNLLQIAVPGTSLAFNN